MILNLLLCLWAAAAVDSEDPFCGVPLGDLSASQPASTREMVLDLQRILHATEPMGSAFRTRAHVKVLEERLKSAPPGSVDLSTAVGLSVSYLNSGETGKGLALLTQLDKALSEGQLPIGPQELRIIKKLLGVGWLRVAEEENCLTNHTTASCLAPIQPEGVHKIERGARMASEIFKGMLRQNTRDLEAKWLLNIAAMTLGEWPDKLAPGHLIPEAAFASDYNLPPFPDIAGSLGLAANDLAGGVVADDFDNDGNTDLLVSSWAIESDSKYYHNVGTGSFHERGRQAGLAGVGGALNMIQADYNNDGFVDVLMLRGDGWVPPGSIRSPCCETIGTELLPM